MSLHARIADTLERANLPLLASALTFDALLAIIPLAILLIAGLGYLVSSSAVDTASAADLIARFLPEHGHGTATDPFVLVEGLVSKLQGYRSRLTWFAIPLSIWFSTRVFGAVRVCLSRIYQVRQRPVKGHFVWSYVAGYLLAKARDTVMVLVVLALAVANTVTTTALTMTAAQGVRVDPRWGFLLTTGGRLAGQGIAFLFGIVLFVLLYRYASPKRMAWPGALLASVVGTVGFELAKRLYGLYLTRVAHGGQFSFDADVGAAMLFILWLWYMSLVFLIGAAVADVWDHARQAKIVEGAVVTT
ncbi:MAG TPA: YihY/virulence factor BrkB family protein [Gemmatimonadales bacterium]